MYYQDSQGLHSSFAQALADLGADPKIIAEALASQPNLTPQQIYDTWAWHQARIAQSDGRLGEGIFFHAIRHGQIHAAPPDPARPIDVERYTNGAYRDLFRLGSDVSDLEGLEGGCWPEAAALRSGQARGDTDRPLHPRPVGGSAGGENL